MTESSSSLTPDECHDRYEAELSSYSIAVYGSLGLNILLVAVLLFLRRRRRRSLSRFVLALGTVKALLGLALMTAFLPSCPWGCKDWSCRDTEEDMWALLVYGRLTLLAGIFWVVASVFDHHHCCGVEGKGEGEGEGERCDRADGTEGDMGYLPPPLTSTTSRSEDAEETSRAGVLLYEGVPVMTASQLSEEEGEEGDLFSV